MHKQYSQLSSLRVRQVQLSHRPNPRKTAACGGSSCECVSAGAEGRMVKGLTGEAFRDARGEGEERRGEESAPRPLFAMSTKLRACMAALRTISSSSLSGRDFIIVREYVWVLRRMCVVMLLQLEMLRAIQWGEYVRDMMI